MYPNVFVAEGFLDEFDNCNNQLKESSIYDTDSENENKKASLMRIRDLLLTSNIYSDITDKALVKYHKKTFGTYNNFKDFVFDKIVKESSTFTNGRRLVIRKQQDDCLQSNFCFFTNNSFEESETKSNKTGRIVLGNDFLKKPFYLQQTFAGEITNEKIPQIEKAKHPCTNLVIIDKYLFSDAPNFQPKIPNLINFLNQLIPANLNKPFELDIIINNQENNNLVESKYKQILEAFPDKISLHIYAPRNFRQEHDRYLITNYATFEIGIPFDRDTNVTCNFYPSNNNKDAIKSAFDTWINKMQLAKDLINDTPDGYGLIKSVWKSDNIKHSIFNY